MDLPPRAIALGRHAPIDGFELIGTELAVGTRSMTDIVAQAGGTPLYVYSEAAITRRIAAVRALLPPRMRLSYAVKANPMPELLRTLTARVDGFDVASAGEIALALAAGMPADRISFAGPGKTAAEIQMATRAGVCVTAESETQLGLVREAAKLAGVTSVAAVRVNPDLELRGAGMRMGGGASPFGIDEETIPGTLARARQAGVRVAGLHFHFGSQILQGQTIAAAMRHCAERALGWIEQGAFATPDGQRREGKQGPEGGGQPAPWVNLGGGFGVPYFAGERELDTEPIAIALAEIATQFHARSPGVELRIELGRYLVADAGVYLARVLERKISRGKVFVIVDGGLHHLQAATGTFGQVLRRNYPVADARRLAPVGDAGTPFNEQTSESPTADIVGPLCTPLDCLGRDVPLAHLAPGDLIAVFRAGAYGRSASPEAFLGHAPCREVLV